MGSTGDKLTYFLIGGFVGAAVALLFAPKSGEETRQFLETSYREGAERLNRAARESKEKLTQRSRDMTSAISEGVDRGKEALARQKEQLTHAIEAGRQAYEQEKKKADFGKSEGEAS